MLGEDDREPVGLISVAAGRMSALARSGDLSEPVPCLGRWRARDVIAHLGGVHRWASRIVSTGSMDGPSFTKSKLHGLELCDWFDDGAGELVATLRAADPSDRCPNFNPGSRDTNAFWIRRQVHETLVHCYDVERALARPTPIPAEVAADGVDEYLDVFVRTRGKQTLTGPLRLTSTDPIRCWTIAPSKRSGRIEIDATDLDPTAEISGPAMALLLLMWRRIGSDHAEIAITGNRTIAASFRRPG